jgi:hypothetical protein
MQAFHANSYYNIIEGQHLLKEDHNPYEFEFLYRSPLFFYTTTWLNLSHYQLLVLFAGVYIFFAYIIVNVVRNSENQLGLFTLLLVNPYTVDLAVSKNLIIFEYLWPLLACYFLNSNSQRTKISALVFGFSLHENPRTALFLSLAGLIMIKKLELPTRRVWEYGAQVLGWLAVFILISFKLNDNNPNFMVNNYYNRIAALSPYPDANFVWEIFHAIAARYRPTLFFIYSATHFFLVAPCYKFFEKLVNQCAKYPEMNKVINPYSALYCYLTFIYWNFNPTPEPFEWMLGLLVLSENRACYISGFILSTICAFLFFVNRNFVVKYWIERDQAEFNLEHGVRITYIVPFLMSLRYNLFIILTLKDKYKKHRVTVAEKQLQADKVAGDGNLKGPIDASG